MISTNKKNYIDCLPIGTILPFCLHLINEIPYGWAICNGQTIYNSKSKLNTIAIPDLTNGEILRGNNISGNSHIGSETHNHTGVTSVYSDGGSATYSDGYPINHSHDIGSSNSIPRSMTVVYIIKVL